MQISEALLKAKNSLLLNGWCQGTGRDPNGNGVCAYWSLVDACYSGGKIDPDNLARCRESLEAVVGGSVAGRNDHPGRTLQEVLDAFDEAISNAKEAGE